MDGEEEERVREGEWTSGRVILNTRELTEQIHLPTLSFPLTIPLPFPLFYPLICLSFFPSAAVSHLLLLSPPIPLISSKSSYISRSVHLPPPLPHCLSLLSPKNQVDLNEQMKRGGERLHRGSPGKAGSALSGSVFVYSGLPHAKLSECFFCHFFSFWSKIIRL